MEFTVKYQNLFKFEEKLKGNGKVKVKLISQSTEIALKCIYSYKNTQDGLKIHILL